MSDSDGDSTARPPVSPMRRKQLQQCFEYGNRKMTQGDFDYANQMFTDCVLGDPGNVIYAQSFVGNLRQKFGNNKRGAKMAGLKGAKARTLIKKAELQKNWEMVLKHGVELLHLNPWDTMALTLISAACAAWGYEEAQLAYLKMALDADPDNYEVNRLAAIELRARGQFDQALACWARVIKSRPDDTEAEKAMSDITVEKTIAKGRYEDADLQVTRSTTETEERGGARLSKEEQLERDIQKKPDGLALYVELSEIYAKKSKFRDSEDVLRRGFEATGDLDMKERLLDAELRRLQRDLMDIKEKYEAEKSEELRSRFYALKEEFTEKTLVMHRFRVERFPANAAFRFDLAVTLQSAGKFKEAIAEFQQAKLDKTRAGVCLLALGQCFQQINQYRLAMTHYDEAVTEISDQDPETKKRALYLAAKLAFALKDYGKAENYASALAGIDFSYKDVSDLLDRIAEKRKDTA